MICASRRRRDTQLSLGRTRAVRRATRQLELLRVADAHAGVEGVRLEAGVRRIAAGACGARWPLAFPRRAAGWMGETHRSCREASWRPGVCLGGCAGRARRAARTKRQRAQAEFDRGMQQRGIRLGEKRAQTTQQHCSSREQSCAISVAACSGSAGCLQEAVCQPASSRGDGERQRLCITAQRAATSPSSALLQQRSGPTCQSPGRRLQESISFRLVPAASWRSTACQWRCRRRPGCQRQSGRRREETDHPLSLAT